MSYQTSYTDYVSLIKIKDYIIMVQTLLFEALRINWFMVYCYR